MTKSELLNDLFDFDQLLVGLIAGIVAGVVNYLTLKPFNLTKV